MSDLTIKADKVRDLKLLILARKISLEYDYCLDSTEVEAESEHLLNEVFDSSEKYTLQDLKDACDRHSGNSSSELSNSLVSTLSKVLK